MNILEDTDTINAILSDLAAKDMVEPMVEPIDDPNNEVDFWDWADIIGIVDEFEPQVMIDDNGERWYVS